MVQAEVRSREEEKQVAKVVQQGSQGAWTKWDLPRRKVTWRDLWRLEPYRISFLLRSVYDTLPSPGRYGWRHHKVLLSLADTIERERVKKRSAYTTAQRAITFLKEGARPMQSTKRKRPSILHAGLMSRIRSRQLAGWGRSQNEPHAGFGVRERRNAGSQGQVGSELATHCGPTNWRVLWLRAETPSEGLCKVAVCCFEGSDDFPSRARLLQFLVPIPRELMWACFILSLFLSLLHKCGSPPPVPISDPACLFLRWRLRVHRRVRLFLHRLLRTVESCPDVCKCSRKSGPEKSEVNCHKKGLRAFPSNIPSDVWILKLGENGITDLKANILRSVPKIESINLERNAIKSIHPQAFSGAKHLMLLNLYGNHITDLPSRGFLGLLNLRFLMLGQNQIGIVKPEMFAGMRNLSDLDLPLNALTTLPSNAFRPLIALKVLDLSLNRIQRISPKAFTGLGQLLFLNLDNNSLKTVPAGAFRPLRSLEMLVLDNNFLSTLSQSALDGLRNLQELYLRNNQLEHIPSEVFSNMPKLSQLALSGNRLKVVNGNMFSHMPELKKLHLHDNPWHCDCNITSLVKWMEQTKATLSPRDALKCASPEDLRNKSLMSLQAGKMYCST
ncbi:uncharacterized protein PAE49_002183 [Odontesthes bonariensis]